MSNVSNAIRNITATTSDPSVGLNGDPVPLSSTQVGGINPSGDLQQVSLDANGRLIVNSGQIFGVQDLKILFNEVAAIAIGIETTINTYVAPVGKISYLLTILNSGGNRAQFNIYSNAILFDKQYTPVTNLSALFDYKTGSSSVPGMVIPVGDTITVKTINSGTSIADYNSRFMILEVTP